MSTTIRVSRHAKETLVRVAARLQERLGKRVDFDEAIRYLARLDASQPKLLEDLVGAIPELSVEELYAERRHDEDRAKRRHGL